MAQTEHGSGDSGPSWAIGIDLGTASTRVAIFRDDKIEIIPDENGHLAMPSCLSATKDGSSPFTACQLKDPANTMLHGKRLIGRGALASKAPEALGVYTGLSIALEGDEQILLRNTHTNHTVPVPEMLSLILLEAKRKAESYLNCIIHDVVVTVPGWWATFERRQIRDAGNIAGLNILHTLAGPTAMAVGIQQQISLPERWDLQVRPKPKTLLICDFGAGKLDLAVVTIDGIVVQTKAIESDPMICGVEFVRRIFNYVTETMTLEQKKCLKRDGLASQRLVTGCEQAMWALSDSTETQILVPTLFEDFDFKHALTRDEFERLCDDLFEETERCLATVLDHAGTKTYEIDEVCFVGGCSHIARVHRLVWGYIRGLFCGAKYDGLGEFEVSGAAIVAALYSSNDHRSASLRSVSILEVASSTISVYHGDEGSTDFVLQNDQLPIEKTKTIYITPSFQCASIWEQRVTGISLQRLYYQNLGNIEFETNPFEFTQDPWISVECTIVVDARNQEARCTLRTTSGGLSVTRVLGLSTHLITNRVGRIMEDSSTSEALCLRSSTESSEASSIEATPLQQFGSRVRDKIVNLLAPEVMGPAVERSYEGIRDYFPSIWRKKNQRQSSPNSMSQTEAQHRPISDRCSGEELLTNNEHNPYEQSHTNFEPLRAPHIGMMVQTGRITDELDESWIVKTQKNGDNDLKGVSPTVFLDRGHGDSQNLNIHNSEEKRETLLYLDGDNETSKARENGTIPGEVEEPLCKLELVGESPDTTKLIELDLTSTAGESLGVTEPDGLADFFSSSRLKSKVSFTDNEFQQISELLHNNGQTAWSDIPRLYTVLRLIDGIEDIESFTACRISDIWFPFTAKTLPATLRPATRSKFLEVQSVVLSKGFRLEKTTDSSPQHAHFSQDETIPFQVKAQLGRGAHGTVEKVISTISHREYARKKFKKAKGLRREEVTNFINELDVLKRVHHSHCVKLLGSYSDLRWFALIMEPVGDCDLVEYYKEVKDDTDKLSLLRTFFGCLANALHYLHISQIRHRDIKPHNIIVKNGRVLITDFGIAYCWENLSRGTTTANSSRTEKYAAPEVMRIGEARNESADTWSLGCVFLEITTVLKGETVENMQAFFAARNDSLCYYANQDAINEWTARLRTRAPEEDNPPLDWVNSMLCRDRSSRVTVGKLFEDIVVETVRGRRAFCCEDCEYHATGSTDEEDDGHLWGE